MIITPLIAIGPPPWNVSTCPYSTRRPPRTPRIIFEQVSSPRSKGCCSRPGRAGNRCVTASLRLIVVRSQLDSLDGLLERTPHGRIDFQDGFDRHNTAEIVGLCSSTALQERGSLSPRRGRDHAATPLRSNERPSRVRGSSTQVATEAGSRRRPDRSSPGIGWLALRYSDRVNSRAAKAQAPPTPHPARSRPEQSSRSCDWRACSPGQDARPM